MAKRTETTAKRAGAAASKTLAGRGTEKDAKRAAASDLTQRSNTGATKAKAS